MRKIIIDDIDLKIIKIFYDLKPSEVTNTYIVTQKVFDKCNSYDVVKKYPLIKNRLKKLNRYGIIEIDQSNGKKVFELQMQKVIFKKIKYRDGFVKSACLNVDDEWCAFTFNY